MAKRFVTVTEAAEAMGVPVSTVRRWCAKGAIPSVQDEAGRIRHLPVSAVSEVNEWAGRSIRLAEMSGW
jgi:excisionase family DNA binding protein